jgi:hypothetical protein
MMRQRKEIGAPNASVFGAFNGGYVQTSNIVERETIEVSRTDEKSAL